MTDVVKIARCPEHGLHGERQECFVCGAQCEQIEMVPLEQVLGGDIAGPGGAHDVGAVVVHTAGALILKYTTVARIDDSDDDLATAILLEGRINQTEHRTKALVLVNADGVAALISELVGFIGRAKGHAGAEVVDRLIERLLANRRKGVDRQP